MGRRAVALAAYPYLSHRLRNRAARCLRTLHRKSKLEEHMITRCQCTASKSVRVWMSTSTKETMYRRRALAAPEILLHCQCHRRLGGKAQISGYKVAAQYVRL